MVIWVRASKKVCKEEKKLRVLEGEEKTEYVSRHETLSI
jgi:hypothetical protein